MAGDSDEGENPRTWNFMNASASASGEKVPRRRPLRTGSDNSWLEQQHGWYPQSAPAGVGRDNNEFGSTDSDGETGELEQKLAAAEAQVHLLKKQLVELATRVQQTLQQPSTAAEAPLVSAASQALSMSLSLN